MLLLQTIWLHDGCSEIRAVGGSHNIFGWGCAARSWKPLPYFRPKYAIFHTLSDLTPKMYTLFQTLWCVANSATVNRLTAYGTSWRPKRCSCLFSSRSMSTATHVTLKTVSQTKQKEYTPYFRPNWLIYGSTGWVRVEETEMHAARLAWRAFPDPPVKTRPKPVPRLFHLLRPPGDERAWERGWFKPFGYDLITMMKIPMDQIAMNGKLLVTV